MYFIDHTLLIKFFKAIEIITLKRLRKFNNLKRDTIHLEGENIVHFMFVKYQILQMKRKFGRKDKTTA